MCVSTSSLDEDRQVTLQVSDLLAAGNRKLTLEEITAVLPFALDKFQAQSVEILLRGSSVVVSAPTGAGKTVIAEAATIAMLARYLLPLLVVQYEKCMIHLD